MDEYTYDESTDGGTAAEPDAGSTSTASKKTSTASDAAARAKAAAAAVTPTSAKDATEKAKAAAYTVVGLGVMGLGKVQAGAKHLVDAVKEKELSEHVATLKEHAGTVAKATTKATTETAAKADQHLESVITKAEERLAPFEEKLPDQARDLVRKAQETGRETRAKVRSKVFSS